MTNYTLADFIVRVKNAVMARRKKIVFPHSRYVKDFATLLTKEGYLASAKDGEQNGKKVLLVEPAYDKRAAVLTDVRVISKPSLRVYATSVQLEKMQQRAMGNLVVSTNVGLMMGKEALKKKIGGEVLFEIW